MQFLKLAQTFDELEAISSRNKMVEVLAHLFDEADAADIPFIVYLIQGSLGPTFKAIQFGIGEKLMAEAIGRASGMTATKVLDHYKKSGDLGLTAEQLLSKTQQMVLAKQPLTISSTYSKLLKLAKTSGAKSQDLKLGLMAELLTSASPLEARYLVRIPLGQLRLGIGDPTILDALSTTAAGDKSLRVPLEHAYNLCSDLGLVAETFVKDGQNSLKNFKIAVGSPIRPALAERLESAEAIVKKVGRCTIEAKYDGFRCQIHKNGNEVQIFSRNLEPTTHMFPDIAEGIRKQISAKQAILEGEALAFNGEEYLPFQQTIQRKRKHGVAEAAEEFPLKLFAFDVLFVDGEDLTGLPYTVRRKKLEKLIKEGDTVLLSEQIVSDDPKEINVFFLDAINRGLEGIIAKDLEAPYVAGARKFAWIKLKRSYQSQLMDTIDVAVLGYYRGRGQRATFGLGGLLAGVYNPKADRFETIAKIGSGFSEQQLLQLKQLLDAAKVLKKPVDVDSIMEPDVWVKPKYVITVAADEITKSPIHTAGRIEGVGFALRFPRMKGWIRTDKAARDATTVAEIKSLFEKQKRTEVSS